MSANPLNHQTRNLLDLCNLYQYHQLIQVPTRITENTASTIDLFMTNNHSKFSRSGVFHIGISDHSLIYAIRKLCIPTRTPNIIISRQFRNFDPNMFREDLALAPWHIIENEKNPSYAWKIWRDMFLHISDRHAPFWQKKQEVLILRGSPLN